jgi:serine protease Do
MKTNLWKPALVVLALGLALLACGGGSPAATEAPAGPVGGPSGKGAVSSVEGVRDATIQVVAEGSLIEPGGAMPDAQWAGSGFIIDPSGIAVTNNHVVTGAARMKVLVAGESEPRNARVLGVSECSDLAVIDIDGDGFPYLQWRQGPVDVGLEVYAAGFPLGNPEYTLTNGVISKAHADGNTSWASIAYVLEHTARQDHGSSGGPLVDADGHVVGIDYSGAVSDQAAYYYAISEEEALPVIQRLQAGEDVNSIGLNGTAYIFQDLGSGIWVASVKSGSVADKAGLKPGDIISTMENISLGREGTMGEYCDILKGHDPTDTLAIEVMRFATGEILDGQLNGRELSTTSTFNPSTGGSQGNSGGNTGGSASGYIDTSDAYGSIAVEIPAAWTDTDGSAWMDGGDVIGATISAAPDLNAFQNTWTAPGMTFAVSDDLARLGGYVQVLDLFRPDLAAVCKLDNRYDYNDGYYRGKFDWFDNCGGPGGASVMVLSAVPTDNSQSFIVLLQLQMLTDDDQVIAQHVLDTFRVIGTLP